MVAEWKIPTDRQLAEILGLGVLWGLIEVYVSPGIKSLEPALFGLVMPFLITLLMLFARWRLPVVGSLFLMGTIAALMEYLLTGMVLHGAGGAILLEALGAELILSLGGLRLVPILLVGMYVELYSAFHPLIFKSQFCQSMHVMLYRRWVLAHFPGLGTELTRPQTWILVIASHTGMGLLAGSCFAAFKRFWSRRKATD